MSSEELQLLRQKKDKRFSLDDIQLGAAPIPEEETKSLESSLS